MQNTTTAVTTAAAVTATAGSYLQRVRAIVPAARTTKRALCARNNKRDTLEDARKKVAQKLRDNKAYVLDSASFEKKPDLVYKVQPDETCSVSVKYGNRYLEGMFDGDNYFAGVSKEQLPELLELFACDAEAGMYDAQIKVVMQSNIAAKHNK